MAFLWGFLIEPTIDAANTNANNRKGIGAGLLETGTR
jgi:hypothetical protein